jgi:hypothetical protein
MTLRPALGNYAAGDRFWDRDREVAEIVGYLAYGQGVLLTGARRVGKTSVVHKVLAELPEPMEGIFLDVEHYDSAAEFFAGLGAAAAATDDRLWQRLRGWFGKRLGDTVDRLDTVEVGVVKVELQAAMTGGWRDDARALVEAVAERDHETVIAVDELPLLVDRILKRDRSEAEMLLSTLRSLAEGYPAVRWLVSGSIGLEPILHGAGLTGTVTHLRAYPIDAWDEATTTGAVEALGPALELTFAPGAAAAVYACLGLGVPYHVQLLMDEMRREAHRHKDPYVTAGDIRRTYEGPFLTSAVRAHLLHLESRLDTVLGEGDALRLARDLLTQAAVAGVTTLADAQALADDLVEDDDQRGAILRRVLEILVHDAYLGRDPDGWRFRSRLVRDWWRQQNELGFVPAGQR